MIPRLKADLRWRDLLALWPSGCDDVAAFEQRFARLAGQKHAVAYPYGRTAQMAILRALPESGRRQVICPAYTCVVVPHAVTLSGFVPVFVDSRSGDFNMDWDLVEKATGPETLAVIATSIFGHPVDLERIAAYRARHPDVIILQDCAHSFMAQSGGAFVQQHGLAAFYGLNVSKIMTSVFGGMVTTDDDALAAKLRAQRQGWLRPASMAKSVQRGLYLIAVIGAFMRPVYSVVQWLERCGLLDRFVKYYDPGRIEMPGDALVALSEVEARVGIAQCQRYERIVAHRRTVAHVYREALAGAACVLPPEDAGATHSHFVIRTDKAARVLQYCLERGVQLGRLIDYNIPDMPAYQGAMFIDRGISRAFVPQVLNLPVHMGVTIKQARRNAAIIREALA